MKTKLLSLSLLVCTIATPAMAEAPSLNYIEGGIKTMEDYEGAELRGKVAVSEHAYITASYFDASDDQTFTPTEIDLRAYNFGIGFAQELSDKALAFTEINYVDRALESAGEKNSDDGYSISVGARAMITDRTEIFTTLSHLEFDAQSTELSAGLRQNLTENIGVYAEYTVNDQDQDGVGLGVSYSF